MHHNPPTADRPRPTADHRRPATGHRPTADHRRPANGHPPPADHRRTANGHRPTAYAFGLLGHPLGHSLSPVLHRAALQAVGLEGEYRLYDVPPEAAERLIPQLLDDLRGGRLHGLNVTIPYKQQVTAWVEDLTDAARGCGAVNTLYAEAGRLVGHNTDAAGFWEDARRRLPLMEAPGWQVVLLGAGGAARAVAYAALRQGWPVHVLARRLEQARALAHHFRAQGRAQVFPHPWKRRTDPAAPWFTGRLPVLLVNATPVGMHPHTQTSPWPEAGPWPRGAAYDLVYNPRETRFVAAARRAGLPATDGLGMLVWQAALAFQRWTGIPAREVLPAMARAVGLDLREI